MDGYGALLAHLEALRQALLAYRAAHGSWPREAEARANPVDVEFMGWWGESPDTLDIRETLAEWAAANDVDHDPMSWSKLEATPGDRQLKLNFEFSPDLAVHLHGARVHDGRLSFYEDGGWIVEVDHFEAPFLERFDVQAGDQAGDLQATLERWRMMRLEPLKGTRVIWVSTPTHACTIHLEGETVTHTGQAERA